jgi:hypothetical protein
MLSINRDYQVSNYVQIVTEKNLNLLLWFIQANKYEANNQNYANHARLDLHQMEYKLVAYKEMAGDRRNRFFRLIF